ncbi:MAG: tRNA (guanine-N7)-methyltransferase [Candidatus Zixiibacteriota bacterium]
MAPPLRVRAFPLEHLAQRPVFTHPEGVERIDADAVEIGPGKGELLLALAAGDKNRRFAAIEVSHERFTKLVRRVKAAGLTNVQLLNGDARVVWHHWVAPGSLEQVIALFPDPWPKRRQAFHRLITAEFLRAVAPTLKPGGEFLIKTDVASYADGIVEEAAMVPAVQVVVDTDSDSRWQRVPTTYYERMQTAAGRAIRRLCLVRV